MADKGAEYADEFGSEYGSGGFECSDDPGDKRKLDIDVKANT